MNQTIKAFQFAQDAHKGQTRGDGKTPYVRHVMQVSLLVAFGGGSQSAVEAALLHDTIEDCGVSYKQLVDEFGIEVANLVGEVTFPAGTPNRKQIQIEAVKGMTPDARLIKLADITANIYDLPSANWQFDKKTRCLKHLLHMRQALSGTNHALEAGFDELATEALDHMFIESLTVQPNGVVEEEVSP